MPRERFAALALTAMTSPEDGLAAARDVLNADVDLGADLGQLALRVILLQATTEEAESAALTALTRDDADLYGPALALLVRDFDYLMMWKDHGYFLSDLRNHLPWNERDDRASSNRPFSPYKPKGLTPAHLKRAAEHGASPDVEYVQYLRVLLDETEDLTPLVQRWEKNSGNDAARRLLVRAIAYLDDPANIPLLERVYAKMDEGSSDQTDFYWTIRIMNGPEILQLRKRIRDRIGIDRLR
jgi:hypothetical protein